MTLYTASLFTSYSRMQQTPAASAATRIAFRTQAIALRKGKTFSHAAMYRTYAKAEVAMKAESTPQISERSV